MAGELVNPKRLTKAPAELRRFHIDFEGMEELRTVTDGGDADSFTGTPTVTATPSGLTITGQDFDVNPATGLSTRIGADLAGGTLEVAYLVRMTGTTLGGAILSRAFYLDVKNV